MEVIYLTINNSIGVRWEIIFGILKCQWSFSEVLPNSAIARWSYQGYQLTLFLFLWQLYHIEQRVTLPQIKLIFHQKIYPFNMSETIQYVRNLMVYKTKLVLICPYITELLFQDFNCYRRLNMPQFQCKSQFSRRIF